MKNIFKKANSNKICITTYFNKTFSEMGEICLKSINKYATLNGLDLKVYNDIFTDRPAPWYKILLIQKILSENYGYVFWVDADALFVNYESNIKDEIEKGRELYLIKHNINGEEIPNTGVFLLKNSRWAKKLLKSIWDMEKYIYHKWWENAALMDLLGYNNLLNNRENNLNLELLKKIKWLDLKWNSLPYICEAADPVINHYAGRPLEFRVKNMKRDWVGISQRFKPKALSDWNAQYAVEPNHILISSKKTKVIHVVITNIGSEPWGNIGWPNNSLIVNLSYHVLSKDRKMILFDGNRASLPDIVWPGESISIPLVIHAAEDPGQYKIQITLVQEGVGWFDINGVSPAEIDMIVTQNTDNNP